ncbi:hypothetical protein ACLOJK_027684 [Asimina triloba]
MSGATESMSKVTRIGAFVSKMKNKPTIKPAVIKGPKAAAAETRNAPAKGPNARRPKKITRFHGKEQARVAEQEVTSIEDQTVEEKSQFFTPKVDRAGTSTDQESKEILKQLYNIEARVVKILKDLLLVKSRVIRENIASGLEPELDNEVEVLLKCRPDDWREFRDLKERIRDKSNIYVLKVGVFFGAPPEHQYGAPSSSPKPAAMAAGDELRRDVQMPNPIRPK